MTLLQHQFYICLNLCSCCCCKMRAYSVRLILIVVYYGVMVNSLPLLSNNLLDVSWTAPCTLGEFRHSNGTCTACTNCADGQQVAEDCTEQTDTVCSCKSGTFLETTSNTCQECRECPSGTSTVRECSKTSDTECSVCPEGQFFDVTDNTCSRCSRCGHQETMLKRCSPNLDTICMPAMVFGSNSKRIRSSPTATTAKIRPKKHEKDDVDYERPSIFYFLPFCGIIIVTLIYAGLKNYESQTNRPFRLSCASLFHCIIPQRSPCTTPPNLTITVNPAPPLNPLPLVSAARAVPLTSFHARQWHNSAFVLPQQAMALTDRADYDSDVHPLRRPRMPTA